jgi:hypothetical protein
MNIIAGKIWQWIYTRLIPPPCQFPPPRASSRRLNRAVPLMILMTCLRLFGQVSVFASPQPMLVTDSIPVKIIGLWDIRACNDSTQPLKLPAERIYIALPQIRLLSASSARIVLSTRQSKNKKAIAAMLIRYGLTIGTSVTAFGPVAASRTVVGALALSGELARSTERELESRIPSIMPFTENLLDGTIALDPKACASRIAFAAKMKNPQPVNISIPAW